MQEKGTCVSVGKCVGSTYRRLVDKTDKIRHFLRNASRSVAEETEVICAKFGNLFKRVKNDGQLAHWEMKQKDNFAKFGEEVFRLKESELNKMFEDQNVKKVVEQIRQDESQIQKIKDAMYVQKKRMEETLIFKRAVDELKSPEARLRRVALRVIERLGKREAIPYLVTLLEDPDQEVRQRAKEIIQKLTALCGQPTPAEA